jgi:hypothetical protein
MRWTDLRIVLVTTEQVFRFALRTVLALMRRGMLKIFLNWGLSAVLQLLFRTIESPARRQALEILRDENGRTLEVRMTNTRTAVMCQQQSFNAAIKDASLRASSPQRFVGDFKWPCYTVFNRKIPC